MNLFDLSARRKRELLPISTRPGVCASFGAGSTPTDGSVVKGEFADFGFAEGANEIIAFRQDGKMHYAWRTGVLAHG